MYTYTYGAHYDRFQDHEGIWFNRNRPHSGNTALIGFLGGLCLKSLKLEWFTFNLPSGRRSDVTIMAGFESTNHRLLPHMFKSSRANRSGGKTIGFRLRDLEDAGTPRSGVSCAQERLVLEVISGHRSKTSELMAVAIPAMSVCF